MSRAVMSWWFLTAKGKVPHLVDEEGRALCGRRVGLQSEGGWGPTTRRPRCRKCETLATQVTRSDP